MKIIKIERHNDCGRTKYWPVCDDAKLFTEMLGAQKFTKQALGYIQKLGYEVVIVNENMNRLEPMHGK